MRELSGFWQGGQREALRALREQYAARIEGLQRALVAVPEKAEQARLTADIERVRAELVDRERGLRHALFGKP